MRFDLPTPSAEYTWFRYIVTAVRGPSQTQHQLNEVELFGVRNDTDSDSDGLPDWYEQQIINAAIEGVPANELDRGDGPYAG